LKEAAYKSLSTLNLDPKPSWKSFELTHHHNAPRLIFKHSSNTLVGEADGEVDLMVSLSHDGGFVIGVCVATRRV